MNPTTTGAVVGITGCATTLVCWALLGFPTHNIPDIPPQLEAISAAIVGVTAWASHAVYVLTAPLFQSLPKMPKEGT